MVNIFSSGCLMCLSISYIIMHFFHQYKDLFEVPPGITVPTSPLTLNNDLFVDKVYHATTHQEYSLNGKLRQLKKDYEQFETQLNHIPIQKTPHRSHSRKGKDQNHTPDITRKGQRVQSEVRGHMLDVGKQREQLQKDSLKRQQWFKSENNNILKHSQLDFIFNKINHVYELQDIKTNTLPTHQFKSQAASLAISDNTNSHNYVAKQRTRNAERDQPNQRSSVANHSESAFSRRQKAKNNLEYRRKKLDQLLKTLW